MTKGIDIVCLLIIATEYSQQLTCPGNCSCSYKDTHAIEANCSYLYADVPGDIGLYKYLEIVLLNNNLIGKLQEGQFEGLSFLKFLDLSWNHIDFVSNKMFAGIFNLKTLKLNFNLLIIANIQFDAFKHLQNVEFFEMFGNINASTYERINYPEAITDMRSLTTLKLDGLQNGVFGFEYLSLKNLTHLSLSGKLGSCALMKISTNFLSNLQYLTKVNLSQCQINLIEAGSFSNLSKLADLDLSLNHYLELSGVKNATIGMSRTNITTLNLDYINARNPITIHKDTLSELNNTGLENLTLNNNYIVKIDSGVIEILPNALKFMSIRDNRIVMGSSMSNFYRLENLEIFDCSFQGHYSTFSKSSKESSEFPNEFEDEPYKFPQKLKYLYGSYLKVYIQFIPPIRSVDNNIEILDLSSNHIEMFGGKWSGFHSLKWFDLSGNGLKYLHPDSFTDMRNLTTFLLNNNRIGRTINFDKTTKTFSSQVNLQYLDLSNNEIKKLPYFIFSNLTRLTTLILKENFLTAIDVHLEGLEQLTLLDLQNNVISEINILQCDVISKLFRKKNLKVNLDNNQLICGCNNPYLLDWFDKYSSQFVNFENYTCKFENGSDMHLANAKELSLKLKVYCDSLRYALYCLIGFALLTLCLSVCAVVSHSRWKLKQIVDFFSRQINPYKPLEDGENYKNIYLSYSDRCSDIVEKVEEHLEKNGLSCFGRHKIEYGKPEVPECTSWLNTSYCIVCFLTNDFISDGFCMQEFRYGVHKGYEIGKQILILISLEDICDDKCEISRYLRKNIPYKPKSGNDLLSYLEKEIRRIHIESNK